MGTVCAQCGFNNPPGMRFCGGCGARLVQAAPDSGEHASAVRLSLAGLGLAMGAEMQQRLRQAGVEATGQRRDVAVLVADLSGFTSLSQRLDGEDLADLERQFFAVLSNNVYKYDGILAKLANDGLVALFGAPIAHENYPERTVRAALAMQNDLRGLSLTLKEQLGVDFSLRIGIHSGSVMVGEIGSDLVMNYTDIGDTVTLPHSILEAAPLGATLVSEALYRQVRTLFDCQQISILNLKGIAKPVVSYRVLGPKTRPGQTRGVAGLYAPMIGRDPELIRLKGAARDLIQKKRGQFALLTGEAGLGKSRLAAEFKASLDPNSTFILEGQSLAYRRISYWLVRDVLYNFLRISSGTQPLQARERLHRSLYKLVAGKAAEGLPYLEHLLSLPYSAPTSAERLSHLDGGQLRQQIFLAVRDVLAALADERPVVMILDDLHWADEASLDLLLFLLESLHQAPIFFLAISPNLSPGSLEKAAAWAKSNLGERFHSIQLQSLSPDQSRQLLSLLLSVSELPDTLRQGILGRAAGIPFHLEEILRLLIDRAVLQSEDGRWRLAPGVDAGALGLPDSLQELILARFDRLDNLQRYVLQTASVIGKDFSLIVLGAVLQDVEPQDLHAAIDALVERAFIMPQAGTHETEYTFYHILMSDAVYSSVPGQESSQMHGQVADTIEKLYGDRLDEQVELLANHYRWSPRPDKALHYLILCGQKSARSYINGQARQNFEVALEILPRIQHTPRQACQVYTGLGDVHTFAGEYPEARRHYLMALQDLQRGEVDQYAGERSSLYRMTARTFERQGDYDQALVHLSQAQQILATTASSHPVERAQVLNDLGWIYFRRGNLAEARQLLAQALDLAEHTEAQDVVASIYNRLGGVAYNNGDWDLAASYLRQSIVLRESLGDLVGLATSFNNLGLLEIEMGMFDSALDNLTRSYEIKNRLGQTEGVAMALNNLGWLRIQRGELKEAGSTLKEALDLARQIGYSSLCREILKNIGELRLAAQEWDEVANVLRGTTRELMGLGATDQLLDTYRLLGEAALGAGDVARAKSWERIGKDLVARLDDRASDLSAVPRGEFMRFRGMVATQLGKWELAQACLKESETIFSKLRSRLYQGRTTFQLGVLARAQGNHQAAQQKFTQAAALYHNVGATLEAQRAEAACDQAILAQKNG